MYVHTAHFTSYVKSNKTSKNKFDKEQLVLLKHMLQPNVQVSTSKVLVRVKV